MKKPPVILTQGLSKDEKIELQRLWDLPDPVITAFKKLIIKKIENTETYAEDFNNVNWPYFRAYKDGQYAAYKFILNLLPDKV